MSYNSGSNRARNFKLTSRFALGRFWNYSPDYSLNCTLLGPITITKLLWNRSQLTAVLQNYCIFCSIRQPFKSEESFQKIDLDLYTELQFHLPFCREKRDFVSGGAAAGVAGITLPSSETYFTQVYFTPVTVPKEPI